MTEQYSERLQSLFAAALELPAAERAAFVDLACAGDPDLLHELTGLLAMDAELVGTTARTVVPQLSQRLEPAAPASMSGLRVGAFRLCEELGRGGMGAVYRAERVDGSVDQEVAIKFVRRELLDAATLKRFQLERQLMASLDHPNIARLLDAAELADGSPYYVMEYVAGVPITEYCDREKLSLRERVALLRLVCGAVAEAHRELIVHRDLKPNNILVAVGGVPKLLDFGIAKPLAAMAGAPLREETGTAQRYFSPHYAAPEQLTGAPVGVACDVYALGLLLFELLAGRRPFDFADLTAGQIERLIVAVPPQAPSIALARNPTPPAGLRPRQLQGDLDGIVLRCLRKDSHQRYASVEQLEADLGNYLDGLPVQARGGHGWYRAQKFIGRNRVAVAASFLGASALLVGLIAFAWQARIAELRAAELEQVSRFQADLLGQVDPTQAGVLLSENVREKFSVAMRKAGLPEAELAQRIAVFARDWLQLNATDVARDLIERTMLQPAAGTIEKQFKDQPVLEASLKQVLADRYKAMGLYDSALLLQERALAIRRSLLGDLHPDTLSSLNNSGELLQFQGKLDAAEPYFRTALEQRRRVLGEDHADTLTSISNLSGLLDLQGKPGEAEPYQREALERLRRKLGEDHLLTLNALASLGSLLESQDKLEEAERYYRATLEKRRRVQGNEHPDTLTTINNLGFLLQGQGKLDAAEPYVREALETQRRVLGEEHPGTVTAINNMGFLLQAQGRLSEAEAYHREALQKGRRVLGEEQYDTLSFINNVGYVLQAQGKLGEAEPYYRETLEKRRRVMGADHPDTLNSLNNMGFLLQAQNKLDEAAPYYRELLEKSDGVLGADNPRTLVYRTNMGSLLQAQAKHDEAAKLLAPAESAVRQAFTGDNAHRLAKFLLSLGKARSGLEQYTSAEENLLEAHAIFLKTPGPNRNDARNCVAALRDLYATWHQAAPDAGHAQKLAEWQGKLDALESPAKP